MAKNAKAANAHDPVFSVRLPELSRRRLQLAATVLDKPIGEVCAAAIDAYVNALPERRNIEALLKTSR